MRVAVGLSGGADSVALLRALVERNTELGLVLHAAHLHHGLRGIEADGDLAFCRELATRLRLQFYEEHVDTATAARADGKSGKPAETIEEAARRLRYDWFCELMRRGDLDAVATAHTLDDQAETVLAKFLRGAWTEGLSGIAPVLRLPEGFILRPMLATTRLEVEAYLVSLGQRWREDSSNRHLSFTRNRVRHELLPLLEGWNPRLRAHLAQMAELARDEEAWWETEVARLAPQLLLPGQPVRGGGRAAGGGTGTGLAVEIGRLAELPTALQRRLLRHGVGQFGVALDFPATEALRSMTLTGRAGQKLAFPGGLQAERTARELRLTIGPAGGEYENPSPATVEYRVQIPGEIEAPSFGLRIQIDVAATNDSASTARKGLSGSPDHVGNWATLRNWKPGDRVRLRYSAAPRKVKEVLERLRVTGMVRARWPVLEIAGKIVWMRGVDLEGDPELKISAEFK